ncbi:phosphoenolpyruvate synthase [Planococcus sp. YIM B11945]|uniref:phosphoenolpyruvate synthase n=1 Tax=Planococcus sp. YIM B11945 TaxID=3435410 RepID=UPI003D7CC1CD
MERYVLDFTEIDKTDLPLVGGKGANLGELAKAGFSVPAGFCVSTFAYRTFLASSSEMDHFFVQLDEVSYNDLDQISQLATKIRHHLTALNMPKEIKNAILSKWHSSGPEKAYAVRSSATAEDLPTASFAGQQDTFLNVLGKEALLQAVQQCWASLFTDRAVSYRAKNGFGHRSVFLSVVVQEMVVPDVSGILFTADPVTGHRHTISIDASYGLGEALVAGLVTADLYQVREGQIVKKQVSTKELAIYSLPEGGTITKSLPLEAQIAQALPDNQILELAAISQQIETHYGSAQDIEWAYANKQFFILQSRPITSLYPLPALSDANFHVFINFGYIQMMTAPIKPLGLSLLSNVTHFFFNERLAPEKRILREAGGRAFADFTNAIVIPPVRRRILKLVGGMDPLLASALREAMTRKEFQHLTVSKKAAFRVARRIAPFVVPAAAKVAGNLLIKNPALAPQKVNEFIDQLVKKAEERLLASSGAERIRLIQSEMERMFPDVLSKIVPYFIAAVIASGFLEKKLERAVGSDHTALLLSRLYKSLPGNVTTEMGLEIGDLADAARPHPELVALLRESQDNGFYQKLPFVSGGLEFQQQLNRFLHTYGTRCAGEIDIAKARWAEDPLQLLPFIISHIQTSSPGEHRSKFLQGAIEADETALEIIAQFDGFEKVQVARAVKLYRHLMGMREHHKFALIRLMFLYKRVLLEEARSLVDRGFLTNKDDVFYLTLEELAGLLENRKLEEIDALIEKRAKEHERNHQLASPRILTSDGEAINGQLANRAGPSGALLGTPVSAGTIEGIARVVLRAEDANLNPGEILVAPYTDPGWTPLFTSAVGLVTEVGGMMTHGSVVAREYGIPAVVGVGNATNLIKDGTRIRIDGTLGFVEILD